MAKILLVEDDNNLREIYEARLQAEGYDIVAAMDGEEALVVAKKEKPDLIISDVMMPRISGFEMLDILRNTEELKHVKIIMLTALGQAEDKTRADQLGADRYLVKSQVTLEDIVKAAQELLGGADTPVPSTPATAAAAAELAQTPPTAAPAATPSPAAAVTPAATTTPTPPDSPATPPPATEPPQPAPEPPVNATPAATDDTAQAPAPEPTNPAAAAAPSPAVAPTAVAPPAADAPTIVTPPPVPAPSDNTGTTATGQDQPATGAQTTSEETAKMNAQIADFVNQGTPAQATAGPVAPTAADPGITTPSQDAAQPKKEDQPAAPAMDPAQADAVISDALKNLVGDQPAPAGATAGPTTEPATAPPVEAPPSAEATPEPTPPVAASPVAPPPVYPSPEPAEPPAPAEAPTETESAPATAPAPTPQGEGQPAPATVLPTSPVSAPAPAAPAPPTTPVNDSVTISGKKIISPIAATNQNNAPSNLQDLLAKEGFGSLDDDHPAQPSGNVVNADSTQAQPHPPGHVIAPGINNTVAAPGASGIDPNSIAL